MDYTKFNLFTMLIILISKDSFTLSVHQIENNNGATIHFLFFVQPIIMKFVLLEGA